MFRLKRSLRTNELVNLKNLETYKKEIICDLN